MSGNLISFIIRLTAHNQQRLLNFSFKLLEDIIISCCNIVKVTNDTLMVNILIN